MDKPRILIVDDEADVRESIKIYLARRIECGLQTASDGKQALELIEKQAFDLILLDIKMQGISGMGVLKKTKVTHPETDVIMITAYDSEQVCREALKEGAVDFIVKPSTLDVICSKVIQILTKRSQYTPKPVKE
jgi:DNA-binding NtrC family response regulator